MCRLTNTIHLNSLFIKAPSEINYTAFRKVLFVVKSVAYASARTDEVSRKNTDISNAFRVHISRDRDDTRVTVSTQKNTQLTLSISRYSECKHMSILRDVEKKCVKTKGCIDVCICTHSVVEIN